MAAPKDADFYEKQIIEMVKSRNGEFEEWLLPQVESAAMNRVILAKIQNEICKEAHLAVFSDGSVGQKKREAHPLLAVYDKLQRTLLLQYKAIGLNYDATPSKINEPTGKAAKAEDPITKFLGAINETTMQIPEIPD